MMPNKKGISESEKEFLMAVNGSSTQNYSRHVRSNDNRKKETFGKCSEKGFSVVGVALHTGDDCKKTVELCQVANKRKMVISVTHRNRSHCLRACELLLPRVLFVQNWFEGVTVTKYW